MLEGMKNILVATAYPNLYKSKESEIYIFTTPTLIEEV